MAIFLTENQQGHRAGHDRLRGHEAHPADARLRHQHRGRGNPRQGRQSVDFEGARRCRSSARSPRRWRRPAPTCRSLFVPPAFTKGAVIEAVDAGMPLAIVITEGVPVHDTAEFFAYAESQGTTRIIGPNCPGLISPGKSNAGIIPADITKAGRVGLVSKSGTLTYQMMYELRDFGFSSCVGIGGDPIIGTTHIDALAAFEDDPETDAIVMIGEIGGDAEERAAAYIKDHVTKPVVGYVAGFTAPEGKTMGHAGAIVSGSSGTAAAKKEALEAVGRQGRQDAVRDRAADAGDPREVLTRACVPGRSLTPHPGGVPGRHTS